MSATTTKVGSARRSAIGTFHGHRCARPAQPRDGASSRPRAVALARTRRAMYYPPMAASSEQSFMKALFHGVIAEGMVTPYPRLRTDEQEVVASLLERLRSFAEKSIDTDAIDREAKIPAHVMEGLRSLGLFGLTIPPELSGLGLSHGATARVMEELGGIDASIAVMVGAHLGIGLPGLLRHGNDEQRQRLLPSLARGERIAAFALSEPRAGTDAAAVITRADRSVDGGGFLVNGSKVWITNGAIADVFTVFTRTGTESLHPRMTALLVERGRGVAAGPEEHTFGVRGTSVTSVTFEDVKVPWRNLLGDRGRGFELAMRVLNEGRVLFAAACLGGAKRVFRVAVERSVERRAFGRPIGEFGMIKDKVARMACRIHALESMLYLTTGLMDARVHDFSLESAICKIFASETYWSVADAGMQIAGGIGFTVGYPYERMLRDARVHLVLQGTNEIMRAFIALSGMRSPGAVISDVEKAMRAPIKGFGVLTDFAVKRARSKFGRDHLDGVHPALRAELVLFEENTAALSREVERVLRKHGGDVTAKQFVQNRIADVAIDLYALAAVLSRTSAIIDQKGVDGARREIELTTGFAHLAARRLESRLDHMEREEDEILKQIADTAYRIGGSPFDENR
jgi:acyl-CoA dehydrogenase family member 9